MTPTDHTPGQRPPRRRLALITGASSGIGRELAHAAAADGFDTVLVARREGALQELRGELSAAFGGEHHVIVVDLLSPGAVGTLVDELRRGGLEPHVLVNNAGIGSFGEFHHTDRERQLAIVRLNVDVLVDLTHALLPGIVTRGWGRVLNVASTAAFQPGPFMASYYASKAFVLSFSEALHEELRGTGTAVTALCPGPVNTEFQHVAGLGESRLAPWFARKGARGVALAGWGGCMAGRAVVIPGALNKFHAAVVRLIPRAAMRRIIRAVQQRTKRPGSGVVR